MPGATALFSDGLDLLAEFLACSRLVADGIAVRYDNAAQWRAAAAELARWSEGEPPAAGAIALDEASLCIMVAEPLWNRLYARALGLGRTVAPDRIGLATRGAGGMLAELSRIPEMAATLQPEPAGLSDAHGEPWQLLPWQPLRALLLRDRLLTQDAMRPRSLHAALPASEAVLDATARKHGFLLRQAGQATQLVCLRGWRRRILGDLERHFTEGVLLLFRLMFYSADQGWGWDAASDQCAGLVTLMDDAEQTGLVGFGEFRDSCAGLAAAIEAAAGSGGHPPAPALMRDALRQLAALWPQDDWQADASSARLLAGWMAQVHPQAWLVRDVQLGPGVVVGRGCIVHPGVVLRSCVEIAPHLVVPAGIVVAAGATVSSLELSGVALPRGTLLGGSVLIHRHAAIGQRVELGADAEIGAGIAIPDGVRVAAGALVRMLYLGTGVRLPAGTVIEGSLIVDSSAEIGADVCFGDNVWIGTGAVIGDGVRLPRDIRVAAGACVRRCVLAGGALFGGGAILHGDVTLGGQAVVGAGVSVGAGAVIGPGVIVPAGVTVQAGARIDLLQLRRCRLPAGTTLGGNLWLGNGCSVAPDVVFCGDNRVASYIDIPAGLHIARGAAIHRLRVADAVLPPGTVIGGSVFVSPGTRIGRGVTLEDGAAVTALTLPHGVTVEQGAVVTRCEVQGAHLGAGMRIGGDLYLARGVRVGSKVRFHKDVNVRCVCQIPDGMEFLPAAVVDQFHIAPGVVAPAGTCVAGSLFLGRGVKIGANVSFGASAVLQGDLSVPDGARIARRARISRLDIAPSARLPACFTLGGDVSIGAGACIGELAVLGADVVIGADVVLPPAVVVLRGAHVLALRIADEVVVPAGTRISGDLVLRRGVRIGPHVEFGPGADIGPHVVVPAGVVIAAGAKVRTICIAPDVLLPRGVCIGGSMTLGAGVTVGHAVRFGAGVRLEPGCTIGNGVWLPDDVVIGRNTRLTTLKIAADVVLPPESCINGNLRIGKGVRVGRHVCFGDGVRICAGVVIPDYTVIMDGARIDRLHVAREVVFTEGLNLQGNAIIHAGVRIAEDVVLGSEVVIGPGVSLPKGVVVADGAQVHALRLGAHVQLPESFEIDGDLCLEDGVVVGEGVRFGAGVVVGAGTVIGREAVIEKQVVIGAGAIIGAHAWLEQSVVVEAGVHVGTGACIALPRQGWQGSETAQQDEGRAFAPGSPPCAEAQFHQWQDYLSGQSGAAALEAQPADAGVVVPSAPIPVPAATILQPRPGNLTLPRPFN